MVKRRILLATATTSAAVLLGVAGCGSTAQPLQVDLAASQVMRQVAQKTQQVTSYTVDAVVNLTHPQQGDGRVQGRMLYQNQPELAVDVTLDTVDFGGQQLPGGVRAILKNDTVYVKVDALKRMFNATKPWFQVKLSDLDRAGEVRTYLDQVRQFDLASVTKMVTTSQDVKSVGTETVDGVATTHYSGTFPVEAAVQQLPAEQRERARTSLAQMKEMTFDVWVGEDGLPRKVRLNGAKEGGTLDATMLFKGFNQPVRIELPPADQIGELPTPTPVPNPSGPAVSPGPDDPAGSPNPPEPMPESTS